MAYRVVWLVLSVLLALGGSAPASAQVGGGDGTPVAASDTVYRLVLSDGSEFHGRIESRTADRLVFVTLGGTRLEVQMSQVRTLEVATGRIVGGEVWRADPNGTRLFFGPTGRSLPSGSGYIGLFELFFSFGAVGIGDRLVLAGGTPVIPGAIGELIYLAPKFRFFSMDGVDLSAGALAFFLTDSFDQGSLGILYGVGTFGDEDRAFTAGAGWGFVLSDSASEIGNEPVFMLGYESRLNSWLKLMTENYMIPAAGTNVLVSGGFRLLGERFSADLGLGGVFGTDDPGCCLPVLSASYSF